MINLPPFTLEEILLLLLPLVGIFCSRQIPWLTEYFPMFLLSTLSIHSSYTFQLPHDQDSNHPKYTELTLYSFRSSIYQQQLFLRFCTIHLYSRCCRSLFFVGNDEDLQIPFISLLAHLFEFNSRRDTFAIYYTNTHPDNVVV